MISFTGRHHQRDMILQCIRWYCAYAISYRDIEEMIAERGYTVDHSTIQRWVVHYSPKLEQASPHWKFLMGAVGNQSLYIRQVETILRRNQRNLTVNVIRSEIESSRLSDTNKDLAISRLELAEQYIDDDHSVKQLIKPGRMVIVDLRDEFISKDEALGLFVALLQMFSEAKYLGESFNKLIVFDECHKYIDSPNLVKGLVETVREMRHKGTSVMIASQDPPSVPKELIELSSQIILHKFNSPYWLKHIQNANAHFKNLTPEKIGDLSPGEAYVWSSKASDLSFTKQAFKIKCRPRVTKHGGDTVTAVD